MLKNNLSINVFSFISYKEIITYFICEFIFMNFKNFSSCDIHRTGLYLFSECYMNFISSFKYYFILMFSMY